MKELMLRNFTEEEVNHFLDRFYKDSEVCQCNICRMDVAAIMLNSLKQKYVVTEKGALFAQLDDFDPQNKVDFITIMNQAIKIVGRSPRH